MAQVRGVLLLIGPALALLIAVPQPLLTIWLGHGVALHTSIILPFATAGFGLYSLVNLTSNYMVARGKPIYTAVFGAANTLVNVVSCLTLISRFGLEGAGLALVLTYWIPGPPLVIYVARRMLGLSYRELLHLYGMPLAILALLGLGVHELAGVWRPALPLLAVCIYTLALAVPFYLVLWITRYITVGELRAMLSLVGRGRQRTAMKPA